MRFLSSFMALLMALAVVTIHADDRLTWGPKDGLIEFTPVPGASLESTLQTETGFWLPVPQHALKTGPGGGLIDIRNDAPSRFYRWYFGPEDHYSGDFRMTDHLGKSHELFYHSSQTGLEAVVLYFISNSCNDWTNDLANLKNLSTKYKSSALFWIIDLDPASSRQNAAALAVKWGITSPIVADSKQQLAREFDVIHAPEVVVLKKAAWENVYQGPADNRNSPLNGPIARNYLAEALSSVIDKTGAIPAVNELERGPCPTGVAPAALPRYAKDIAPILRDRCVTCHSPGNIGSFQMTNYATVQAYSFSMKQEIMSGRMPPWHADPEYGNFADNISLTPSEKRKLIDWLSEGAPKWADEPDPLTEPTPEPPKWPVELGEPDVVITIPVQQVKAGGIEAYRYIYADTGLSEDKYLRAAIVRPGNRKVVHHYIVWEGKSSSAMFTGIALYAPGRTARAYPEGTGVLLHKDAGLTFNLHYTPDGESSTDQPELGLWFAKTPPAKVLKLNPVSDLSFLFGFSSIPARNPDFEITANYTFPQAATIYSLNPHMHVRGSRMRFDLTLPNGSKETLLNVPYYNFDWQTVYKLATPRAVPAGSKITVIGAYDNSSLNPNNPDPSKAVKWGEQSFEEMFIGYVEYTE